MELGVLLMMLYIGVEIDPRELGKASGAGFLAAIPAVAGRPDFRERWLAAENTEALRSLLLPPTPVGAE